MTELENIKEIAERITYHIRKQFEEHQKELSARNPEDTIDVDSMLPKLEEMMNIITSKSITQEEWERRIEIEEAYIHKYGPTMKKDEPFRGDNIVLSEQNLDDLMGWVRESVETVGLEGLPHEMNVSIFVYNAIYKLDRYLTGQEERPDTTEKIKKMDEFLKYYWSIGCVGVSTDDVICKVGDGKFFEMKRRSSDDILLSVGTDGTIEIDKGAITMEALTKESLGVGISTSELSELGEFESTDPQRLGSKTDGKGEK